MTSISNRSLPCPATSNVWPSTCAPSSVRNCSRIKISISISTNHLCSRNHCSPNGIRFYRRARQTTNESTLIHRFGLNSPSPNLHSNSLSPTTTIRSTVRWLIYIFSSIFLSLDWLEYTVLYCGR